MVPITSHPAPPRDDLDAHCDRIHARLLDGIEQTLDALAQPNAQPASRRAAIARAVWTHVAPLYCRHVTCRRAQVCRRTPCTVPRAAASAQRQPLAGRNP